MLSEATSLPTEPQPLPYLSIYLLRFLSLTLWNADKRNDGCDQVAENCLSSEFIAKDSDVAKKAAA